MQQQADPQHALDPLLLLNASPVTCIALLTAQEESLLLLGSKGAVFVAVWVPRLNQPVRRVTSITLTPELQPVSFIHRLHDDDEPKTIRMLCTCGSVVTLTCASGTVTLADMPVTVPLVDGRLWWCGFSLSDGADALLCNGSSKVYRGAVEERRGSRVPLAEIGLGDEACEWQLGSYRDGLTGLVDGNREGVILLIVDARSNPPIVTVLCNRELRSAASAFANPMLTGAEDSPVRVIALERTRDWGTFMTSCGVVENGDHRMRIVFGTATTPQLDMVDVIDDDAEEGEVTPRISCTALRHVPSEASSTSALVLLSSATLCASQVRDLHQQSVEYILAD